MITEKLDETGVERLLEQVWARGYRRALHLCGDAHEAEDLLHDSVVALLRDVRRRGWPQDVESWFLRIIVNTAHNRARSLERRRRREASAARAEGVPPASLETDDELRQVRACLASLDPELRSAVVLKHVDGLTFKAVAELLGCPEGTAASRVRRGLERMRESMPAAAVPLLLSRLDEAAVTPPARPQAAQLLSSAAPRRGLVQASALALVTLLALAALAVSTWSSPRALDATAAAVGEAQRPSQAADSPPPNTEGSLALPSASGPTEGAEGSTVDSTTQAIAGLDLAAGPGLVEETFPLHRVLWRGEPDDEARRAVRSRVEALPFRVKPGPTPVAELFEWFRFEDHQFVVPQAVGRRLVADLGAARTVGEALAALEAQVGLRSLIDPSGTFVHLDGTLPAADVLDLIRKVTGPERWSPPTSLSIESDQLRVRASRELLADVRRLLDVFAARSREVRVRFVAAEDGRVLPDVMVSARDAGWSAAGPDGWSVVHLPRVEPSFTPWELHRDPGLWLELSGVARRTTATVVGWVDGRRSVEHVLEDPGCPDELELRLERCERGVNLRVVDAHGRPQRDVRVSVSELGVSLQTDDEGLVVLRGIAGPRNSIRVWVQDDRHERFQARYADVSVTDPPVAASVEVLPLANLDLELVDQSGAPLSGTLQLVSDDPRMPHHLRPLQGVEVTGRGQWKMPAFSGYRLRFVAKRGRESPFGSGLWDVDEPLDLREDRQLRKVIDTTRRAAIAGNVVPPPPAGTTLSVGIRAADARRWHSANVATDGSFRIDGVPPGRYLVAVESARGPTGTTFLDPTHLQEVVIDRGLHRIELTYDARPVVAPPEEEELAPAAERAFDVRVRGADGQVVVDARLAVSDVPSADRFPRFDRATDARGRATVEAPAASWVLSVQADGFSPATYVRDDEARGPIDVRLSRTASLRVDVDVPLDADGHAPENVFAFVRGVDPVGEDGRLPFFARPVANDETKKRAGGVRFQLACPTGEELELVVVAPGRALVRERLRLDGDHELRLRVAEPGPTLRGIVETPDGRPCPGVIVVAALPEPVTSDGWTQYAVADAEGRFVLAALEPDVVLTASGQVWTGVQHANYRLVQAAGPRTGEVRLRLVLESAH